MAQELSPAPPPLHPPPASPSPARAVLGRFALLGAGSQRQGATYYRGRDNHTGNSCTIKLVPRASLTPGVLMRLEYEATLVATLESASLPRLLAAAEEGDD